MGRSLPRNPKILGRKTFAGSELEVHMVTWIILAVVFIVLLFAYMRVRGRRVSR
jgi:hypothetical protein